MNELDGHNADRLCDLLADRAVQGLAEPEARELDRLLAHAPGVDSISFDLAAAAADLALTGPAVARMPDALRAKVESAAMSRLRPAVNAGATRTPGRQAGLEPATPIGSFANRPGSRPMLDADPRRNAQPAWLTYSGWVAAAAMLAVAVAGWWPGEGRASPPGGAITAGGAQLAGFHRAAESPARACEKLLASAGANVLRVPWVSPADGTPRPGDAVWDNARQEGYLRLASLPVNDPSVEQYQLWIICGTQRHPIDGGVFDVAHDGEVVVPIVPKLRVGSPTAFIITVEKPGGVVVSAQERPALVATVKS